MEEKILQLQNRRYIGAKYKLSSWIFSILKKETKGSVFTDIFAGTGIISGEASKSYDKVIINDFLYSNNIIYQAFFGKGIYDSKIIEKKISEYNNLLGKNLKSNYFSENFGGKYFSLESAKKIGFIREDLELNKNNLTEKEFSILLTSLLYALDKIANTVGHYDAYFRKTIIKDGIFLYPLRQIEVKNIEIFREDANNLAKKISSDVVYIDPPYNSRQYSRFYHVLETLVKWDKPKLYGVALKPEPENISDYCKVAAGQKLLELVTDLDTKYLAVSYNNTYESKSNSSRNKITLEEIRRILDNIGRTQVFERKYKHFNSGKTNLKDHKEYLFVTKKR